MEFYEELVSVAGGPINITRIRNNRNEDFKEATHNFIKTVSEEKLDSRVQSFLASLQANCSQLFAQVSPRVPSSQKVEISENDFKGGNEVMNSPAEAGGADGQQMKAQMKRYFLDSAIVLEESYKCKTCPADRAPFTNFKAYQRHVHQKHPEEDKITAEDLPKTNKIKCLLSSNKIPGRLCNHPVKKNDICRHLRDCHGEHRPDKKIFKGFFSTDEKVSYFPAWGFKNQIFDEEELIEIEIQAEEGVAVEIEPEKAESGVNTNSALMESEILEDNNSSTQLIGVENKEDPGSSSMLVEEEIQGKDEDDGTLHQSASENLSESLGGQGNIHSSSEDMEEDVRSVQSVSEAPSMSLGEQATILSSREDPDINKTYTVSGVAIESRLNPTKNTVVGLDTMESQVSASSENDMNVLTQGPSEENVLDDDGLVGAYVPLPIDQLQHDVMLSSAAIGIENDIDELESVSSIKNPVMETQDSASCVTENNNNNILESSHSPSIVGFENILHENEEDYTDSSDDEKDGADDIVLVKTSEPGDKFAYSSQKQEADVSFTELRHQRRNDLEPIQKLADLEDNAEFIKAFRTWQISTNFSNPNAEKVSTLRFSMLHLFTAPDSWLNYFTMANPEFNLNKLLQFESDSFVAIPSPINWLTLLGGQSGQEFPVRRHECVKAFKRLLDYLLFKLSEKVFGKKTLQLKRDIKDHIKDISDMVDKMNYHHNLRTIAKSQTSQKKEMSDIICPPDEESEYLAVSAWFGSPESKAVEKEAQDIWKKSKKLSSKEALNKKEFTRVGNITYLELALADKLRTGVYNVLTNRDFAKKKEVYLPAGFSDPNYDKLPANWKIYQKPKLDPNATPSRYEIRIPGDRPGMKNKQPQTITLNMRTHEILSRYQDIKRKKFGQNLDLNAPFFVNYEGGDMAELRNYKGSLLNLVGKVVNVPNFTLKTTRKGVDAKIQNDESLRNQIKALNSHSVEVGRDHYDNMNFARRTVLSNSLNKVEGSDLKRSLEVCEETAKKRARIEENEQEQLKIDAQKYLDGEKKKKPKDLSPNALPERDLLLLRTLFKDKTSGIFVVNFGRFNSI